MPMNSTQMGSLTSLRQRNVTQVLSVLRRQGGMTQVELADMTHLSTATISSIVRELTDKGKVQTTSVSRNGRHALFVSLATDDAIVVGISIESNDLYVVLGDASHGVLSAKHLPLAGRHQSDTTMIRMLELLREMVDAAERELADIKSAVIALPVPIDNAGHIVVPEIMPGWSAEEIADGFFAGTGVRPFIANDADMACIAQMRAVGAELHDDMVYIHADNEIGGAIVVNGDLYRGGSGLAGEFGHIQVDPNGSICSCGRRGCLNTVVGGHTLRSLLLPTRGDMTLRDIINDALAGDAACLRLMEEVASKIAKAVEPVISSFDPQLVVLGGRLSRVGDSFLTSFGQTLTRQMFPMQVDREVVLGRAGEDASAVGAMYLAASRITVEE